MLVAVIIRAMSHRTSETMVNFYQTTRRYPEDSHLHTRRREYLKSHDFETLFIFVVKVSILSGLRTETSTIRGSNLSSN
jgi:hypothetical protein